MSIVIKFLVQLIDYLLPPFDPVKFEEIFKEAFIHSGSSNGRSRRSGD